jgi:hypothetical protein
MEMKMVFFDIGIHPASFNGAQGCREAGAARFNWRAPGASFIPFAAESVNPDFTAAMSRSFVTSKRRLTSLGTGGLRRVVFSSSPALSAGEVLKLQFERGGSTVQ